MPALTIRIMTRGAMVINNEMTDHEMIDLSRRIKILIIVMIGDMETMTGDMETMIGDMETKTEGMEIV